MRHLAIRDRAGVGKTDLFTSESHDSSGEKLAIVGLNGAGKTTLVKLICGFYDPDEGEVLLNGVNIKTYNRRDYYRLIAGVFQDFSLIPASVAANVAQDIEHIDRKKVQDCIEKAGLRQKNRVALRGV